MHETFSIKTSVKATVIFSKESAGPSRSSSAYWIKCPSGLLFI